MKLDSGLNRIAFFLIATLVALIVLSAIIPQQDYAEEQVLDWRELLGDAYAVVTALGLDRIYFTPFFFIVLGCLGVTLALGNIRRFHLVYRVEGTLLRARHLGSIIFHLALLLIMTGVILNYLFKFNGVFALTEGQSARDAATAYFRVFAGPLRAQANDRFRITLETVHNAFPVEASTTEAADIMVLPAAAATPLAATIRTNAPLAWNDLEFHFGSLTGFSPELHVSDTGGGTLFRGFVRLATRRAKRVRGLRHFARRGSEGRTEGGPDGSRKHPGTLPRHARTGARDPL
jgi:cytochrome c biogenesis protein ResB